jgi:hypothetical protein
LWHRARAAIVIIGSNVQLPDPQVYCGVAQV